MVSVTGIAAENRPDVPGRRRLKFSRSARLLKRGDFERVYKTGKRHFAPHLTLFYVVPGTANQPRVGLTVGRALGGAVDRNRIKRRLREAVRLHRSELQGAADMVVNPKKSVLTVQFSDLENDIQRAFQVVQKAIDSRGK